MKAHTQRILENLNTTVLLVDAQLQLRSINPAGELLFEISARQIVGQALGDLLPNNPALIDAMRQALASGHPYTEHGLHLLFSGRRDIAIDCTVTPLTDDRGQGAAGFFGMIAHIDLKRKALGIDKARERVLFDMDMRREMAEAAHAAEH